MRTTRLVLMVFIVILLTPFVTAHSLEETNNSMEGMMSMQCSMCGWFGWIFSFFGLLLIIALTVFITVLTIWFWKKIKKER